MPEVDRIRLMGHSLKGDILNGTYGHRGLAELREKIEKVKVMGEGDAQDDKKGDKKMSIIKNI